MAKCSHSCLLCLCVWNSENPGRFQNKSASLFLKWVPEYILLGEGRQKAFLEWKSIKISSKLSLTCDWNFSYYKSVYHPFPTCGNKEHPSNFQNKSLSSPFSWVSRYILFLAKLKRKGRPFLKVARRKPTLWDYPEEHLVVIIRDEKVSPFVKFERILLFLCLSLAHGVHGVLWCWILWS